MPTGHHVSAENDYSIVYNIFMLSNLIINFMQRRQFYKRRGQALSYGAAGCHLCRRLRPRRAPLPLRRSSSASAEYRRQWISLRYSACASTPIIRAISRYFSGILLVELHHIGQMKQARRILKAANTRDLLKYKYFPIYC